MKIIPPFLAEYINDKTWLEDLDHENGAYLNDCNICKDQFLGHKRRLQCNSCAKDMYKNIVLMTDEQIDKLGAAWDELDNSKD